MNKLRPQSKLSNSYKVENFSMDFLENYQLFAKKNFGFLSYQHSIHYLNYLYKDCPETRGFEDFRVLRNKSHNNPIAGCLHRVSSSLLHTETGDSFKISGLHNLMIDNSHYGHGYMLLADALKNDNIFFVPGVSGELEKFYKRVASYKVKANWFRALRLSRLIPTTKRFLRIPVSKAEASKAFKKLASNNLNFLLEYSEHFNALIEKDFNSIKGYRVRRNFFLWRIFSHTPQINPNLVTRIVLHDNNGFIAISLGIRKNIPVLRIVYCSLYSQESANFLIQTCCNLASELGFPVILIASDSNFVQSTMKTLKFTKIDNAPSIYFCSKNKKNVYTKHWQLLGDYGLDELSFNSK